MEGTLWVTMYFDLKTKYTPSRQKSSTIAVTTFSRTISLDIRNKWFFSSRKRVFIFIKSLIFLIHELFSVDDCELVYTQRKIFSS